MNLPATVRVYVNETGVSVSAGSTVLDAVRQVFPDQADAIAAGTMRVTDSRGLPTSASLPVTGGGIFRVLPVRETVARHEGAE